jgi:hypothetical protein
MARCETCGNEYDKAFQVIMKGTTHTFDSFECAIHALAPICNNCGIHILGHGLEKEGTFFCCDHCAEVKGVTGAAGPNRSGWRHRNGFALISCLEDSGTLADAADHAIEDWGRPTPSLPRRRKPMDDPNNTGALDEADEDILTYTVSDEAVEAAAGIESGTPPFTVTMRNCGYPCPGGKD